MVEYILNIERFKEQVLKRQTDDKKFTISHAGLELLVFEDIKQELILDPTKSSIMMDDAREVLKEMGYDRINFPGSEITDVYTLESGKMSYRSANE